MLKKIIVLIPLIMFLFFNNANGEDLLGFGVHLGAQRGVGDLSISVGGLGVDPRDNYLIGMSMKANLGILFVRIGVDTFPKTYSYVNTRYQTYSGVFIGLPAFTGFHFPVQNIGAFYMGGGIAKFYGWGSLDEAAGTTVDFKVNTMTYGVLSGIQIDLTESLKMYLEWMYIDGRSDPVIGSETSGDYNEVYVDFTGYRIIFGMMYYLL